MRVCSLGSGSKGNASVVASNTATILIDCGFPFSNLRRRLEEKGVGLDDLDGLLLTHEHIDHVRGLVQFTKQTNTRIYMTQGTARSLASPPEEFEIVCPHTPFTVSEFHITPFPIPHDAAEPVQYVIRDNDSCLGFLTDAGTVTDHAKTVLEDCNVLVLECNYDAKRLRDNRNYPQQLKRRISGSHGHLGNGESGHLLRMLASRRLLHVVAAHLSENNNLPELASNSIVQELNGFGQVKVSVASQQDGFNWIDF